MIAPDEIEKTLASIDAEMEAHQYPDDGHDTDKPFTVDGIAWRQPPESGTHIRREPPDEAGRPCWACYLEPNPEAGIYRAGVWFHGIKPGKGDQPPVQYDRWLSSPLLIEAVTRTPGYRHYGRLLRYRVEGRWCTWNMPMQILGGEPAELRRELLAAGVEMDHRNPRGILDYLHSKTPRRRIHAAMEIGWHGEAFVLTDRVFGDEDIYFQSESAVLTEYTAAGEMRGWQREIAAMAQGNAPMAFAISAAMAGPLLHLVHAQGCGFHLVGGSSCGKTTALQAAASVWGGPELVRNWRATANGLEAAAAEANDLCLILDEIGECVPREVGRVVYALGNGTGKSRATQKGYARRVRRWRTVLLSSGERTLDSIMREAGERVTAGQDVRLLSIVADDFDHGAFSDLHGHASGSALSNAIKTACANHYGTAGRAWLSWLVSHRTRPWDEILRAIVDAMNPENGQESRAARAFALAAMAGEHAIEAGILPWKIGEAMNAATVMWSRWKQTRGEGPSELRQVIESLAGFIARNEDRFENIDGGPSTRFINDRAGYEKGGYFHFIPAVFKEAIGGIDADMARRLLIDEGLMESGDGKHTTRKIRVGSSTRRVISVSSAILNR